MGRHEDTSRDNESPGPVKRRTNLIGVDDRIDEIGKRALEEARRREALERMTREDRPKPP
jgi:hypothetical protein